MLGLASFFIEQEFTNSKMVRNANTDNENLLILILILTVI